MGVMHGFERILDREIQELKTRAELFRHVKTGAELLSLTNEDENKVFGVTFRTPPSDSTGVPHILEHSVLCGSRKYPVKEPFVELLKGSLQTFLNAFTYPDKTCYPVASQNLQDFYNLIDIYLDAVLYPRLTPQVFQQEGWHYDIERKDGPMNYKGVVFNEMKGVHSSPDSLLAEYSQQSLFPDTTYGLDSGGDPKQIPNLGFEQFKAFHSTFYHPSNARIYFYGDDDPEKRLVLLNDYLKDFEKMEISSGIPLQKAFDRPRRLTRFFAAGEDQSTKGMLTLNWLLGETGEPERNLALHMLEYILLGMAGSPLRKALIDSNYGEDLAGEGLGSDLRQMYFSVGLKGIEPKNVSKVEALILETLERLAREGIDPLTVEAALNTVEFDLRENNTGNFPRGLVIMLRALNSWLYGGDPLALVAFEAPLEAVKSAASAVGNYFEGLIERFFLKNPHRTTLIMEPDPDMAEREEREERERLERGRKAMSPDDLEAAVRAAGTLKRIQETPDPPEALAAVPSLRLTDLEKRNRLIPLAISEREGVPLLYHELFTNGIVYLDIGFNLHTLPQKYLPYVRLFGRALLEMGTDTEDFVTISQRISRKTGGIRPGYFTSVTKGPGRSAAAWLFLHGKAMVRQTKDLLGILRDVLLTVKLDNRERFRQMVLESKARLEQRLVPAGHQIVNSRLRANYSEADWAAERMAGLSYLFFLRDLADAVDKDWPGVLRDLEEMRRILVNRRAMVLNVTLDAEGWRGVESQVEAFLGLLPERPIHIQEWIPEGIDGFEGLTIPAQVNYVGKAGSLYPLGYRYHGSAHVVCRYLRNSWLWDRVRVQGGAYGAFCLFDRLSGVLSFVSYRDPNLIKTLESFDDSAKFLQGISLTNEELTKAIIGAIGDMDQFQLPDAKGFTSMVRHLSGETDEDRQRIREEVMGTTAEDFKHFGAVLEKAVDKGLVKVLGAEGAIREVACGGEIPLKILKVL
ncbi:MAG: insulinase family protein [Desulfatiglandales bacterium]